MKPLLFDFEKMSEKDKSVVQAAKLFARAGAQVVSSEVAKTLSRRAGIAFRNVDFTFADGQTVTLSVKETGDIFEIKVNGKLTPIREQDDHGKAIAEIAGRMDKGRSAFQSALAKVKVALPPSIRVSRTTMLAAKVTKRDALKEAVGIARETLAGLTSAGAPAAA